MAAWAGMFAGARAALAGIGLVTATRVYLDYNATTPLHPRAREAFVRALDVDGNASSVHAEGRQARDVVEAARDAVAGLVGGVPAGVTFTSGATEALNLALSPAFGRSGEPCETLFLPAGEHPAVLQGHRFPEDATVTLPSLADGTLDLAALSVALARHAGQRPLLALQAANNETGVIQPVAAAAELVHAAGGLLVCDAVQAVGRIPCDFATLGADAIVLSAHKFGGPKGAGALCLAPGLDVALPLVRGGGQERGRRAGTENVAAIAGLGAAAELVAQLRADMPRLAGLRTAAEALVRRVAPDAVLFGAAAPRLANTSCFAVPGLEAQLLLMGLDMEGVAVSSGAACSSGKVRRSHVLEAMGVGADLGRGAIRISFGWDSTPTDVEAFGAALERVVRQVQARRLSRAA